MNTKIIEELTRQKAQYEQSAEDCGKVGNMSAYNFWQGKVTAIDEMLVFIPLNPPTSDELRSALKENGFYTSNLWSVDDVLGLDATLTLTTEEAQTILDRALTNEATYEQIWYALKHHLEEWVDE